MLRPDPLNYGLNKRRKHKHSYAAWAPRYRRMTTSQQLVLRLRER